LNDKIDKLYIPQGTESLHLDEAYTHKAILRDMEDNFHGWGYLPVQTPVFDYFDDYQNLLTPERKDETYRLIDREGELLMLRSDITLFLARQLSLQLTEESLPVRAYYADSILRYQDKEDISHNEFFQVGCELIGKDDIEGDMEGILLAKSQLEKVGLKRFRIHIGSRALFNRLTPKLSDKKRHDFSKYLDERFTEKQLEVLLKSYTEDEAKDIIHFFSFIGTIDEFHEFITKLTSSFKKTIEKELNYLLQLANELAPLDKEGLIRIDMSEIGSQSYYSGIVFQCYAPGTDSAIATGGRYDNLIQCEGKKVSSFGFSMYQRKLETLLPSRKISELKKLSSDKSFAQRFKEAESLRRQNKRVIL